MAAMRWTRARSAETLLVVVNAGTMTGRHMHSGMMGSGMHGGMMIGRGRTMRMVPSRATIEDIPGGARLVLTPATPSQLGALREQARMRAAMMRQGRCPMMQASPPAGPRKPPRPQATLPG